MSKMKNTAKYMLMALVFGLMLACESEEVFFDSSVQLEEDLLEINDFLSREGINARQDPSGFFYQVIEEGEPITRTYCSWYFDVTFHLMDSTYILSTDRDLDQSLGYAGLWFDLYEIRPCYNSINLPQVLAKLDGLIGVGGKIELFVPSGLAFAREGSLGFSELSTPGALPRPQIPPNANLLISAELKIVE